MTNLNIETPNSKEPVMTTVDHKIDFFAIIGIDGANPNGDPMNTNMPRTDLEGHGIITPVCLKRKIRNRLQIMGESIFVQSDSRNTDGYKSLQARLEATFGGKEIYKKAEIDAPAFKQQCCARFTDIRMLGGLLALPNKKGKKGKAEGDPEESEKGMSIGITGPITVSQAISLQPINIETHQITKSVAGSEDSRSDTMGQMFSVSKNQYCFYGSISPLLAKRTGSTQADVTKFLQALCTMFEADASCARPAGSMWVEKVMVWHHPVGDLGLCSSHRVYDSVTVNPDGSVTLKDIQGSNGLVEVLKREAVADTLPTDKLILDELAGF